MRITPTHKHDCAKCRFITATHSDAGATYDWYICGTQFPSIIGRFDSDGPAYWSTDVRTLEANFDKPVFIMGENRYAWSERMQIAHWVYRRVYRMWREQP